MKKRLILLIGLPFFLQAQETIIVHGTRIESHLDQTSLHQKIDLDSNTPFSLSQILEKKAGLHFSNSGEFGGDNKVSLRGTRARHTLVVIDGVEVNDVSSPDRAFDFAHLDSSQIESVEILKGPQGVLYGSDAIGGVIYIKTKNPHNTNPKIKLNSSYGSFHTTELKGEVLQSKELIDYSLSFSSKKSQGVSKISPRINPLGDVDGQDYQSLKGLFHFKWHPRFKSKIILQQVQNEIELDSLLGQDDPNDFSTYKQSMGSLQNTYTSQSGLLTLNFHTHYQEVKRNQVEAKDANNLLTTQTENLGESQKAFLQANFAISEIFTVHAGLEAQVEKMRINNLMGERKRNSTYGFFNHYSFSISSIKNKFGFRYENHDIFDDQFVYQWRPSWTYQPWNFTIELQYSTGFKAPTIFDLFDPTYGNRNLQPEEVVHYELALSQKGKKYALSTSFYSTKVSDQITFDSNFRSINQGDIDVRGIEFEANVSPVRQVEFNLSYNRNKTLNTQTGFQSLRIPSWKGSFSLLYHLNDQTSTHIDHEYIGRRDDFPTNSPQGLSSYSLTHITFHHKFSSQLNALLEIRNIFDKKYENIKNFQGLPRSFRLGISTSVDL